MAPVVTVNVGNITKQDLHGLGINPFAVELLVESYASPDRSSGFLPTPITFVYRGVKVTLEPYVAP